MKDQPVNKQQELNQKQKEEVLRRDMNFVKGKTAARSWDDVKKDLEKIYR